MLIDGLSCICGYNKIYYYRINVDGISDVNQLACPNCGIIMRSPPTDENGGWLKNHWKKTHGIVKTLTAERDEYKRRAEAVGSAKTRYPTWQEWYSTNFPNFADYITPCNFMPMQEVEALMGKRCADLRCCQCIKLPIPADIAKRLGVQPIAKENSG